MKNSFQAATIAFVLVMFTSCKTVEEQHPSPVETTEKAPKRQSDALHDFKPAAIKL
ncbi:MAG: hypothetical protein ABIP20_16870 [Chthoniobacteraceae bacterium]